MNKDKTISDLLEEMQRKKEENFLSYILRLMDEKIIKNVPPREFESTWDFIDRLIEAEVIILPEMTVSKNKTIPILYRGVCDKRIAKGKILYCQMRGYEPHFIEI